MRRASMRTLRFRRGTASRASTLKRPAPRRSVSFVRVPIPRTYSKSAKAFGQCIADRRSAPQGQLTSECGADHEPSPLLPGNVLCGRGFNWLMVATLLFGGAVLASLGIPDMFDPLGEQAFCLFA